MLSHKQFAALVLLKAAPQCVQAEHPDMTALLSRGLVEWATLPHGSWHLRITAKGHLALQVAEGTA